MATGGLTLRANFPAIRQPFTATMATGVSTTFRTLPDWANTKYVGMGVDSRFR
jgi:hypothetical protein